MNNNLHHWYPVKLLKDGAELRCQWKYFKGIPFIDPFFSETITQANSIELNVTKYRSVSDLNILTEWCDNLKSAEPTAFIFHISRCGSTLLSQALALSDDHIVLSEVPFIDDLLKLLTIDEWLTNTDYQQILKATIAVYGQKTNQNQQLLFIKTDSWHLYYLPLFRLLYPAILFLFLYREPDDVLISQQKKRGMHAVPGLISNIILGIPTNTNEQLTLDNHMIGVLISYLSSFVTVVKTDNYSFLANYSEGIENIINNLAKLTGYKLDEDYCAKVNERCRYNAKYPDQPFINETTYRDLTNTSKLQSLYMELENLRSLQISKTDSVADYDKS